MLTSHKNNVGVAGYGNQACLLIVLKSLFPLKLLKNLFFFDCESIDYAKTVS